MEWTEVLFSFDGRINRKTFWLQGFLPLLAISLVVGFVFGFVGVYSEGIALLIMIIGGLALSFMSIAISVKRWHDLGVSGWFTLFQFVPLVGTVVFLLLGLLTGTKGANQYGPPQGEDRWGGRDPWVGRA